jgi:three-Cys-motif partner protein
MNEEGLQPVNDDLVCPEVGGWTEDKHSLVSLYSKMFSTGMKGKWGKRVYVELYAGAGYSRIRGSAKLILGSPLRALSVDEPFDKYIFCEAIPQNLEALKVRVMRHAPAANVSYIEGPCDHRVAEILSEIPIGSRDKTVLTLCFADPYDIGLKFTTIKALSSRFVDFVVLLAVYSDANRAYNRYVMEDATKVDDFLGSTTWRVRWETAQVNGVQFPRFLAQEFASSMETLGYLPTPIHKMKLVRSDEKNLPLYFIAMFSRKELAYRFWDEVLKYHTNQTQFSWE